MQQVTIYDVETDAEAAAACKKEFGWTPESVREVDSGDEWRRAWRCFESAVDAELWDSQN